MLLSVACTTTTYVTDDVYYRAPAHVVSNYHWNVYVGYNPFFNPYYYSSYYTYYTYTPYYYYNQHWKHYNKNVKYGPRKYNGVGTTIPTKPNSRSVTPRKTPKRTHSTPEPRRTTTTYSTPKRTYKPPTRSYSTPRKTPTRTSPINRGKR